MTICINIQEKIKAYDDENGTSFMAVLADKTSAPRSNDYSAGVIHGILLALSQLGVITNSDAVDILDEYRSTCAA
jgi:hypothetical protein